MGRSWRWTKLRNQIVQKDGNRCTRCGTEFKQKRKVDGWVTWESNLIVDHKLPIALGGLEFDENNLQTLCVDCNRIKNKFDQSLIAKYRREVGEVHHAN